METLDRIALERKKMPELKSMIRQLGADSQPGETKESIINRILLFKPPQKWGEDEPAKREVIDALPTEEIMEVLSAHIERGLKVEVIDGCWHMTYKGRTDSGTMAMQPWLMKRCADILMR